MAATVGLIAGLRGRISELEAALEEATARSAATPPLRSAAPDREALAGEVARLRTERATVRERVRTLIREIDRGTG